uniref:Uncharacterized protein n=1 Tax=Fagus sylvatica TaxID=28930 RepID=A0A2N9HPD6_FAGSY
MQAGTAAAGGTAAAVTVAVTAAGGVGGAVIAAVTAAGGAVTAAGGAGTAAAAVHLFFYLRLVKGDFTDSHLADAESS